MKKASLINLGVIIGILVLCVMTLLAVYATAPESTILLLNESFDVLNKNTWQHEMSECKEGSDQFHYVTADEENRLISDGVLHIYPNITNVYFRTKREANSKCFSCVHPENSTLGCISSSLSAKLQSRNAFEASHGRVEIRAKLLCGKQLKFDIGIIHNRNNSDPEDFESLIDSGNTSSGNSSSEIRILFEAASNRTIITREITDNKFHTYVINWDEERVTVSVDNRKLDEKKLEEADVREENISNGTVKPDSAPIRKPFYLSLGVRFEENSLESFRNHSHSKRSLNDKTDLNESSFQVSSILEENVRSIKIYMDYKTDRDCSSID